MQPTMPSMVLLSSVDVNIGTTPFAYLETVVVLDFFIVSDTKAVRPITTFSLAIHVIRITPVALRTCVVLEKFMNRKSH